MIIKRLITQIRFWLYMGNGYKRAEYAKKKGLFGVIGEHVKLPITLPLYPKLVRIHNNVVMHHSVKLITHDYMNATFLMKIPNSYQFRHKEILCPIEIMDNVYIGMDCIILGNVRIGPNVIINSGSVVVSDVPPNSIVSGVPAKVVGNFEMFKKTRMLMDKFIDFDFKRSGKEQIDDKAVKSAWALFEKKKNRPQRNKK